MEDRNFRRRLISNSQDAIHLPAGYKRLKYLYCNYPDLLYSLSETMQDNLKFKDVELYGGPYDIISEQLPTSIVVDFGLRVPINKEGLEGIIDIKSNEDKGLKNPTEQFKCYFRNSDNFSSVKLGKAYFSGHKLSDGTYDENFVRYSIPNSISTASKNYFFIKTANTSNPKSSNDFLENGIYYKTFQHFIMSTGYSTYEEDYVSGTNDKYCTLSNGINTYEMKGSDVNANYESDDMKNGSASINYGYIYKLDIDISSALIFSIKIKRHDEIALNLIPCYEEETKLYGLFDTIGNKFFSNYTSNANRYITGGNDLIYGGGNS